MVSQTAKRSAHNKTIDDYSIYLLFVIVICMLVLVLFFPFVVIPDIFPCMIYIYLSAHYKVLFSIFTRMSRTEKIEHKLLSILQSACLVFRWIHFLIISTYPLKMLTHSARIRTDWKTSASCINESLREISVFCGFYQIFFSSLISLIHSVCSNQQYRHICREGNWGNHVEWCELSGHAPEVSGETTVGEYWL